MKLHEIKQKKEKNTFTFVIDGSDFDVQFGEDVIVKAKYFYEPESSSDHPYGDGFANERHSADYGFEWLKLEKAIDEVDEEGKTVKTYPAGFDVRDLPGFTKKVETYYEEEIIKHVE